MIKVDKATGQVKPNINKDDKNSWVFQSLRGCFLVMLLHVFLLRKKGAGKAAAVWKRGYDKRRK